MREVLTIQVGHYANFVGSHFWNLQEHRFNKLKDQSDVSSEILYRADESERGITRYRPRAMIFDLKGSLGALSTEGIFQPRARAEYTNAAAASAQKAWQGSVDTIEAEVEEVPHHVGIAPHEDASEDVPASGEFETAKREEDQAFRTNLDSRARVWSDYLRSEFHPRTISELPDANFGMTDWDIYASGKQHFNAPAFNDETLSNLEHFAEECDNMQGVQILVDSDTAWGGFSEGLLEMLRDELGNIPIMVYSLSDSHNAHAHLNPTKKQSAARKAAINSALSLHSLNELASAVVPISTAPLAHPSLQVLTRFNPALRYHTSALIAAALDNVTIPFRRFSSPQMMSDACLTLFLSPSAKLAALSSTFPFRIPTSGADRCIESVLLATAPSHLSPHFSFTPFGDKEGTEDKILSDFSVVYGLNDLPVYHDRAHSKTSTLPSDLHDPNRAIEYCLGLRAPHAIKRTICSFSEKFLPSPTFPHIFSPHLDAQGNYNELLESEAGSGSGSASGTLDVRSCSTMASLRVTKRLADHVRHSVPHLSAHDRAVLFAYEMASEEWESITESLSEMADSYEQAI